MLLNPDKSEMLLIAGWMQTLEFAGRTDVSVAGSDITFAVQLKSLGVVIDRSLSFDQHVKNIVKASNFHIRGLCHIDPFLTRKLQTPLLAAL